MTCVAPPFARAVLAEASRIAPGRRVSSDGTCGDAAHQAEVSDHNPSGPNNFCHAVDISQSVPGAPYWDPKYAVFDAHGYGWEIGKRMLAGTEKRVKYLVSFNGQVDVILNLAVSREWRQNGSAKTEHANHLHVSFTPEAEQSVAPFFAYATPEDDMTTEAQVRDIVEEIVKKYATTIMADTHKILDDTVKRIGNYFPSK